MAFNYEAHAEREDRMWAELQANEILLGPFPNPHRVTIRYGYSVSHPTEMVATYVAEQPERKSFAIFISEFWELP